MNTKLIDALKQSLADSFTMYLHAHGYHWNVVGPQFAQLHEFFGEIYEDVYSAIDPLAENIRKMDGLAPFHLSTFAQLTDIKDQNPMTADAMISSLMDINLKVLVNLNATFDVANSTNEQGIANFIAERIDMHEKWAWQLKSFKG
jgi:starvation-inducible DNA-binding protein